MINGEQSRRSAPPELLAAADQVRFMCAGITKMARADLQTRLEKHDSGISAIEHGVLRHLSQGVSSMAEISRRMGVAPSTLVYVVDGLVKKKLVRRDKDPKDRRREPLVLEKRGAALFAGIPKVDAESLLVKGLACMEASRRDAFVGLLREFAEGLPGWERHRPVGEVVELDWNSESSEQGPSATRVRRRNHE
jgi:DNA-binding MarR family transcriptional regulator